MEKGRTNIMHGLTRLLSIALCVLLFGTLSGCGSSSSTAPNGPKQQSTQQQAAPLVSAPSQPSTNQSTAKSTPTSTEATSKSSSSTSTQSSPSSQPSQAKTVTPAPAPPTNNQSMTVYIGATGSKYHYQDCRTLKGTKTPISMKDAKARGKTACGVCDPPQ